MSLFKITAAPVVKKFFVCGGTRSIHNFLSLTPSLRELIKSTISDTTALKSFLILSSNLSLRLLSGLIPLVLPPKFRILVLLPYHTCHMTCPTYVPCCYHYGILFNNIICSDDNAKRYGMDYVLLENIPPHHLSWHCDRKFIFLTSEICSDMTFNRL